MTDNPESGTSSPTVASISVLLISLTPIINSDIAGANAADWSSVLVRTGVYDPEQGPPTHRPTHIAEDVEEAVDWAIERTVEKMRGGR